MNDTMLELLACVSCVSVVCEICLYIVCLHSRDTDAAEQETDSDFEVHKMTTVSTLHIS